MYPAAPKEYFQQRGRILKQKTEFLPKVRQRVRANASDWDAGQESAAAACFLSSYEL
jgi:hypothetical protein